MIEAAPIVALLNMDTSDASSFKPSGGKGRAIRSEVDFCSP